MRSLHSKLSNSSIIKMVNILCINIVVILYQRAHKQGLGFFRFTSKDLLITIEIIKLKKKNPLFLLCKLYRKKFQKTMEVLYRCSSIFLKNAKLIISFILIPLNFHLVQKCLSNNEYVITSYPHNREMQGYVKNNTYMQKERVNIISFTNDE